MNCLCQINVTKIDTKFLLDLVIFIVNFCKVNLRKAIAILDTSLQNLVQQVFGNKVLILIDIICFLMI